MSLKCLSLIHISGYENGPAEIGLAWTEDEELLDWHFPDKPCFSWKDGADWEAGGLYKACIIRNNDIWYMFYNAKDKEERWTEQTGVATSKDLLHWERYEGNPVMKVNRESWEDVYKRQLIHSLGESRMLRKIMWWNCSMSFIQR